MWDVLFSTYSLTCDLANMSFDLGGHGACRWYGYSYSVCVPSSKFVGLPSQKIWHTSGLSISRPGDLDLRPFTLKLVLFIARGVDTLLPILVFLWRFFLDDKTCRPTPVRGVTWPTTLIWPWRSWRLSLMRVFVFRLCTKVEVRRPSSSEGIGHLLCEH